MMEPQARLPYDKTSILNLLHHLEIQFSIHEHEAVYTSAEADIATASLAGFHAKNLFLGNADNSRFYLYFCDESQRVDMKTLARLSGEKRLRFADQPAMESLLGITPGAVSILGLANDSDQEVTAIFEKDAWNAEFLQVHPLVNTATIIISHQGLEKFLSYTGNPIMIYDPEINQLTNLSLT